MTNRTSRYQQQSAEGNSYLGAISRRDRILHLLGLEGVAKPSISFCASCTSPGGRVTVRSRQNSGMALTSSGYQEIDRLCSSEFKQNR